jgi:hypothetical protein
LTEERTPDQYVRTIKKVIKYVASKFTSFTSDLVKGLQALSLDDPQPPTDPHPTDPITVGKISLRQHESKLRAYQNFRAGLYNLVFGQCSDALHDKIKSHHDFDAYNKNGIALLLIVKALTHTFEEQLYLPDATSSVLREFYDAKQLELEGL